MIQSSSELQKKVYRRVADIKQVVASDPYRLHYHLMPPVGLLNDPNGFVFYKGEYHVFYQWNPFETAHGAKFWGHYISDDLVRWEEASIALAPDSWFDKDGCYSGSTIVHEDKMYVFYTGNVKDDEGNRKSYQCLAVSEDGLTFEKKGPVIEVPKGYTAHFRDPKVFYQDKRWYMVLGAQTEAEKGEAVLYSSSDLESWNFRGTLTGSGHHGLGDFGYMWECPDLLEVNGKDILLVCPQGIPARGFEFQNIFQSGYFAGKVNLEKPTFDHGEFVELDRGFDFYAPQTTMDDNGRYLLFGWMGNAEEEDIIQPTIRNEWIHALTIPRELEWKDGALLQRPALELKDLRENEIIYSDIILGSQGKSFQVINGLVYELLIEIKEWNAKNLLIQLGSSTSIMFDQTTQVFSFERVNFNGKELEQRHYSLDELHTLQIFKDTSSVEVFVNDGEAVFTSRIFDRGQEIVFKADGRIALNMSKWDIKRITAY